VFLLPCIGRHALLQAATSGASMNRWHEHKLSYLVLSIIARDVRTVLVSRISSESAFSTIGRIVEERQRRLA
jgi:hypothetical protein